MQRFGNVWKMWTRETSHGRLGRTSRFKYFTTRLRIPPTVKKATINYWSHNRITLTGWTNCHHDSNTAPPEIIHVNVRYQKGEKPNPHYKVAINLLKSTLSAYLVFTVVTDLSK